MAKRFLVLGLLLAVVVAAGCVMPTKGAVLAPVMVTKSPVAMVDNAVRPARCGTAMSKGIILLAIGDASIEAAMADGNISRVHHIDSEELSVLGLYCEQTIYVWGE